jgi:hypothetical protein
MCGNNIPPPNNKSPNQTIFFLKNNIKNG